MRLAERIAGRYQPLERVAAGGMGVVYRARDETAELDVALKVLRDDQPQLAERFEREVRLLGRLDHPGIVRYQDHGLIDQQRPFLVMEWVEGPTLRQHIDEHGMTPNEAVAVAVQLADALALAHQAGVLHRDVKPSNVILRGGEIEHAVLIDFGLARRADRSDGLTRTGVALGTPGYMAPEQALGRADLDARADVFALGCVLYECLTGVAPFTGLHRTAVLAKLVLSEPSPASLFAHVSPALEKLLAGLLAKRPEDRSGDCRDVSRVLAALPSSASDARALGQPLATSQPTAADSSDSSEMVAIVVIPEAPGSPALAAPERQSDDATLARLADGAMVMLIEGSPEGTRRAASWALEVRNLNPTASVSMASQPTAAEARGQARGAAIDRATGAILGNSIREAFDETAGGEIALDERTAANLADPFETTVVGSRILLRR